MPWILFLLALVSLVLAFRAATVGLVLVCLAAGLALVVGGVLQLLARRIESRTRDVRQVLAPELLRRDPVVGAPHANAQAPENSGTDPMRSHPRDP